MAWCRLGDKPLSEPMVVSLLTHICIIRPQWVKHKLQIYMNRTTTKHKTCVYFLGCTLSLFTWYRDQFQEITLPECQVCDCGRWETHKWESESGMVGPTGSIPLPCTLLWCCRQEVREYTFASGIICDLHAKWDINIPIADLTGV